MASIELGQPDGAQPTGAQPSIPDGEVDRITIPVNGGKIPVKTSAERIYLRFDWSDAIPNGVTLANVVHTVTAADAVVKEDESTNGDGTSDLDVSGGAHGLLTQLTIVATLSDASQVSRTWPLRVFNS
jgi:hypothetical protein